MGSLVDGRVCRPRLAGVAADDEGARRRAGTGGSDDAGVDRAEVQAADRLEVAEAGPQLVGDLLFVEPFVLHEEAAAGPAVLHPADPGPDLLARDAGPLLGVDGVQPVAPTGAVTERQRSTSTTSPLGGITELSRIRLKLATPATTSAASKADSSVVP